MRKRRATRSTPRRRNRWSRVRAAPFYTVRKGDTLSAIAKRHYGDANAYNSIFEANRPMLDHPDRIYPGQVLRIPPR